MLNRLDQLFRKLGYNKENGLYYFDDLNNWFHKFPYRISRVLRDIIKPYAFFSPIANNSNDSDHPAPLNNPIILFFNEPNTEEEKNIFKWSFSFSQAPILIINNSDESISIYHGYDFDDKKPSLLKEVKVDINEFEIDKLTTGLTWKKLYNKYFKNVSKVDKYLLKNITDARRILVAKDIGSLEPSIANKLIGRLLFIRYLIDRNVSFKDQVYILGNSKIERQESFIELLKNKDKLYSFFEYLTNKFDGDLFPLIENNSVSYREKDLVNDDHIEIMYSFFSCGNFFKKDNTYKGYFVQQSLFNMYDFEVIPVELISNIYENFIGQSGENENSIHELKNIDKNKQKKVKAYYTPPFLVDYILSQTVSPFLEKSSKAECKVLDPSCGSGIFLVEALRKIIEKEMIINPKKDNEDKPYIDNDRLWDILHKNIFGIDIDKDAIEITIFSLYITLLDYKKPIEIENFKFHRLKGVNLFGGEEADFFNLNHEFNRKFTEEVNLDFIFGNPPWGTVKESFYINYVKARSYKELDISEDKSIKLEIGNNEISQAFLIRVSDFINSNKNTKCVFIVTGKNLYNSSNKFKSWRKYFLNNFVVEKVLELSPVNNKIAGGNNIFEAALQSTVIISYYPVKHGDQASENILKHITVRYNNFFHFFKTVIIYKNDVKRIKQKYFMVNKKGYDWLWKVLLHGNTLDFKFIKRLKEDFYSLRDIMEYHNLSMKGGLKTIDNSIAKKDRSSTEEIKDWPFLEVDSNEYFQPFLVKSTKTWSDKVKELEQISRIDNKAKIYENMNVGYLPDKYFFEGEKILIKKGLKVDSHFNAITAYSNEDIVFSSSVCSIKAKKGEANTDNISNLFRSIVGLLNSELFSYFILLSGSSVGIDRSRADFSEFLDFPISFNNDISDLSLKVQNEVFYNNTDKAEYYKKLLEKAILKAYNIDEVEKSLLDYAIDITIPIIKREVIKNKNDIFMTLNIRDREKDKSYIISYINIFTEHFKNKYIHKNFVADIHINNMFIGINFKIINKDISRDEILYFNNENANFSSIIGDLGLYNLSNNLYIQQDVRGFNKESFFIIKPNEKKLWHEALAYFDLIEFIDAIARAELKRGKVANAKG